MDWSKLYMSGDGGSQVSAPESVTQRVDPKAAPITERQSPRPASSDIDLGNVMKAGRFANQIVGSPQIGKALAAAQTVIDMAQGKINPGQAALSLGSTFLGQQISNMLGPLASPLVGGINAAMSTPPSATNQQMGSAATGGMMSSAVSLGGYLFGGPIGGLAAGFLRDPIMEDSRRGYIADAWDSRQFETRHDAVEDFYDYSPYESSRLADIDRFTGGGSPFGLDAHYEGTSRGTMQKAAGDVFGANLESRRPAQTLSDYFNLSDIDFGSGYDLGDWGSDIDFGDRESREGGMGGV